MIKDADFKHPAYRREFKPGNIYIYNNLHALVYMGRNTRGNHIFYRIAKIGNLNSYNMKADMLYNADDIIQEALKDFMEYPADNECIYEMNFSNIRVYGPVEKINVSKKQFDSWLSKSAMLGDGIGEKGSIALTNDDIVHKYKRVPENMLEIGKLYVWSKNDIEIENSIGVHRNNLLYIGKNKDNKHAFVLINTHLTPITSKEQLHNILAYNITKFGVKQIKHPVVYESNNKIEYSLDFEMLKQYIKLHTPVKFEDMQVGRIYACTSIFFNEENEDVTGLILCTSISRDKTKYKYRAIGTVKDLLEHISDTDDLYNYLSNKALSEDKVKYNMSNKAYNLIKYRQINNLVIDIGKLKKLLK